MPPKTDSRDTGTPHIAVGGSARPAPPVLRLPFPTLRPATTLGAVIPHLDPADSPPMPELTLPTRKPRDDEMDVFGLSHPGRVRQENQDHFLMATIHRRMAVLRSNLDEVTSRFPPEEERVAYLAMIADGVGGGVGGAEASATALETLVDYVENSVTVYYGRRREETDLSELLQRAAMEAHDAVRRRREEQGVRGTMATTLTMYIGVWPDYYLLQVGDSRYYVLRNGVLTQVTRDQTMAQDLLDGGILSQADAARTPLAHVLSSAIGADTTAPVVTRLKFDWNNVHLLCSDGLTKHVSDERIAEVLRTMTSAKQACETLLEEALAGGGTDNITIIVGKTTPNGP
jgi:serine/threonine protein phosphatase PrpC